MGEGKAMVELDTQETQEDRRPGTETDNNTERDGWIDR